MLLLGLHGWLYGGFCPEKEPFTMANLPDNNVTDNVVSVRENEQQCVALPLLLEPVVSAQAGGVAAARSHNVNCSGCCNRL